MNKLALTSLLSFLFVVVAGGTFMYLSGNVDAHDMEERRGHFIEHKHSIISELIMQGDYKCCLEQPCTYCIEKTPGHGEGATCHCLEDVVNGEHPCGECIGEIMEGHGNKFLSIYFARAIAEEMGGQYHEVLKQMMYDKYSIDVEDQL